MAAQNGRRTKATKWPPSPGFFHFVLLVVVVVVVAAAAVVVVLFLLETFGHSLVLICLSLFYFFC